jgi:hypothetical protein
VDILTIAAVTIAFLAAGVVKGVIGVGLPLTAIAVLGNVMSLRVAIPLLVIPVMITNVWQAMQGTQFGPLFRRFLTMNVGSCIGLWFGTRLLYAIDDARPFAVVLGLMVCAYAAMNLSALKIRIHTRYEPLISPVLGLASGVLGGVTGSIGVPMIVYLQALGLNKEDFVQAINFTFFAASLVWVAALINEGALDVRTAVVSSAAVIPAVVGMGAGRMVRERISQQRFRIFVFGFLIVTGVSLIAKAMF